MVKHNKRKSELMSRIQTRRSWRWSLRGLYALLAIALFANFLANDKPLLCSYKGEWYAPVFKAVGVDLGLTNWPADQVRMRWYKEKEDMDWAIWPPVHYGPNQQDIYNNSFTSPFKPQDVENNWWRHWLGTDELGRDVLAGMIWGTRTALFIGLGAMLIAGFIGVLLGSLAGYFGNNGLQLSRHSIYGALLGAMMGLFLGFITRQPLWQARQYTTYIIGGLAIFLLLTYAFALLFKYIWRRPSGQKQLALPVDSILMRIIEIINSIPGLLLLLSLVTIIREASILSIVLIIGLLSWTTIARFVRGELLRIRELEYIDAARIMGFHPLRILWKQALPNALGPVYVALAFGVSGAVMLEAGLSFLSIGMPGDVASWGRLLSYAREAPEAWWLAVVPGLAIFVTVVIFNYLGEAVSGE
ncbi:MAG: ABC transporter permease [Bacteroidota bacterium]